MLASRIVFAGIIGLLGLPLYIASLYSYYWVIAIPEGSGNTLRAAMGFGIGFGAAFISSVLLALSALISGSKVCRVSLVVLWIVGVLAAVILSYDVLLGREPDILERGFSEIVRNVLFIETLVLSSIPYTPLILVVLYGARR